MSAVYVCPERDIVCGDRPAHWCATCPKWADLPADHPALDRRATPPATTSLMTALLALHAAVKESNEAGEAFDQTPLFQDELAAIDSILSPDLLATTSAAADFEARQKVAAALGLTELGVVGTNNGKRVSYAWEYLLGLIEEAAKEGSAAAAGAIPELRQIVEIDHSSDMAVALRFTSCRAASSFFQQVKDARWPDAAAPSPSEPVAQAEQQPNPMLCPLCEADRSKEPCQGANPLKCHFAATAYAAEPAQQPQEALPPLPEPECYVLGRECTEPRYTADQMNERYLQGFRDGSRAPVPEAGLTDEQIDAVGKRMLGKAYGNTDRDFARAILSAAKGGKQ